jgi:hypothetical protein
MKFASKSSKAKDRWVKWNVEFANNGEGYANEMPIALKDDLYAKEKTHMGWNLRTKEYVR